MRKKTIVSNPPNEKVCEELFLAYTLQYARKLTLYAPSQREEYLTGYDAALFTGNCRELILQFKRVHSNSQGLYFDIDEGSSNQRNLLQAYPDNSAFYVAGSFENIKDLFDAQSNQLTTAGFLDRYIAVPAHVLINGVRVYLTKRNRYARSYYEDIDGNNQELRPHERFMGSELLKRFLDITRFEVGALLRINRASKRVEVLSNSGKDDTEKSFSPNQEILVNLLAGDNQGLSVVFIRYCD